MPPSPLQASILFEDDSILVINKPAGLMVEPDRNGHPNLLHQVRAYLKLKAEDGVEIYAQHIHRLDRPVSGVILFAKQRAVLKNLSEQFAERRVKKFYQALTLHSPLQMKGELRSWLRKEKKKAILYDHQIEFSEEAVLKYEVTELPSGKFRWDIELLTGKYHQIRAQLAREGCPIVGDLLYGSIDPYEPDAIALLACKLMFTHPVTHEPLTFLAPEFMG